VQRISDLLASLLRQLAEGQSPLSKPVVDLYGLHKRKQTRPLLEEISKTLHSVAVSYSKIFILVDALDECEDVNGCRTRFLSEIFTIQEKCNLHFLATSRFIPGISQQFRGSEMQEILANSDDIQKYLDSRIPLLPSFVQRNVELQEEIKSGIIESVQGM